MLSQFTSDKFRFWSFISMTLLVYVHGYNLDERYLEIVTQPNEALTATTFVEYLFANGILRFRIPMLFLISGYLYAMHDSAPNRDRVQKRVRTLLLPYLLWSGICLLLFYGAELFTVTRAWIYNSHIAQIDGTRRLVHEYTWGEILGRWIFAPLPYQLWFIRVLFVYNLAYPLLRRWVVGQRSKPIFFSIAVFLWLGSAGFYFFEGEGLLFFSLGVWMQKTGFDIGKPGRRLDPGGWALVFFLAAATKTLLAFDGQAMLGNAVFPLLFVLHKLTVASGLIAAWYGCDPLVRWCMGRRWFVWLTSFSFIIYALHAPWVAVAIDPTFELLGRGPGHQLLTFVFLPLVIIAICVLLGALLRKVTPGLYGLLTGGRGF